MIIKGAGIDLKREKKSVEQALRELKILVEEDIENLKANRYYVQPSKIRREKEKVRQANIRRYNKYN